MDSFIHAAAALPSCAGAVLLQRVTGAITPRRTAVALIAGMLFVRALVGSAPDDPPPVDPVVAEPVPLPPPSAPPPVVEQEPEETAPDDADPYARGGLLNRLRAEESTGGDPDEGRPPYSAFDWRGRPIE